MKPRVRGWSHEETCTTERRALLGPKTLRNRVSNLFRKLRVADRVQAAIRAREARLGFGPGPR